MPLNQLSILTRLFYNVTYWVVIGYFQVAQFYHLQSWNYSMPVPYAVKGKRETISCILWRPVLVSFGCSQCSLFTMFGLLKCMPLDVT